MVVDQSGNGSQYSPATLKVTETLSGVHFLTSINFSMLIEETNAYSIHNKYCKHIILFMEFSMGKGFTTILFVLVLAMAGSTNAAQPKRSLPVVNVALIINISTSADWGELVCYSMLYGCSYY